MPRFTDYNPANTPLNADDKFIIEQDGQTKYVNASQLITVTDANKIGDGSVDNTEFGYLSGVNAPIQGQIDNKADVDHTHVIADVDGLQTALDDKADVDHTHSISQVTGLQTALDSKVASSSLNELVDDRVADLLIAGSNISLSYDDTAGSITISATGGGGGGPASTDDLSEGSTNLYFTNERAQDAIGAAVNTTLVYDDAANSLGRAAISGDITIVAGSNTAAISSGVIVDADVNASAAIASTKIAVDDSLLTNISGTTNQDIITSIDAALSDVGILADGSNTVLSGSGTAASPYVITVDLSTSNVWTGAQTFDTANLYTAKILGTGATLNFNSPSEYPRDTSFSYVNTSGNLVVASTVSYPSLTELTYVKGVTSNIQTQLNAKAAAAFSTGFGITIDGGGSAITTGSKGYVTVPFAMTITGWTIVGDQSGSVVVDVKKSSYAGFPTTSSIAGTEKPTLSSAQKNQDTSLSSWTTSVSAGDIIEFVVDSASTVTRVDITVYGTRA